MAFCCVRWLSHQQQSEHITLPQYLLCWMRIDTGIVAPAIENICFHRAGVVWAVPYGNAVLFDAQNPGQMRTHASAVVCDEHCNMMAQRKKARWIM